MVAYNTGSDPIEFGDLGSKVKVTVTENVCQNDEKKNRLEFKCKYFFILRFIIGFKILLP